MIKSLHTEARAASLPPERALWPGCATTPAQQQASGRLSKADMMLAMLRAARARGAALSLAEIVRAGVAQHSARILELRQRGHKIRNHMVRLNGVAHSTYTLDFDWEAGR